MPLLMFHFHVVCLLKHVCLLGHLLRRAGILRALASKALRVRVSSEGKKRNRKRERGVHLSSYTGLIQVLPGHPLADPSSRLSRTQHQDIRDTNEGLVENTCNGDIRIHPSDPKEQEVIYTSVPALSSD